MCRCVREWLWESEDASAGLGWARLSGRGSVGRVYVRCACTSSSSMGRVCVVLVVCGPPLAVPQQLLCAVTAV